MHPALDHIALVVFDLDGTLIDSAPDLATAVDAVLGERGLPPAGVDKVRDWVGNGTHKLVERALTDATRASGEPASEADVDAAHARFLIHYGAAPCERTLLYEGAGELLETLTAAGVACALVTNKPAAFLPPILERFGLGDRFAVTVGGDTLARKKPHPDPLLHAAERTGISPDRALMIGDSRHDVAAGKAAGFRTLAVTYGYNHGEPVRDSAPDHVVDPLAELLPQGETLSPHAT